MKKSVFFVLGAALLSPVFVFSVFAEKQRCSTQACQSEGASENRAAARMDRIDTDGSGTVSLQEFQSTKRGQKYPDRAAKKFARLDLDQNGEVTPAEFEQVLAERPQRMLEKLDVDSSGAVSYDEFMAGKKAQKHPNRAQRHFVRIDADGDGQITIEELAAAKPRKGHRGGQHRQQQG